MREMDRAVNNWGNCQPTAWIAGTNPINVAESVKLATKRGMTVENEANPRANPKNPPSRRLTIVLCRNSLWICWEGNKVKVSFQEKPRMRNIPGFDMWVRDEELVVEV